MHRRHNRYFQSGLMHFLLWIIFRDQISCQSIRYAIFARLWVADFQRAGVEESNAMRRNKDECCLKWRRRKLLRNSLWGITRISPACCLKSTGRGGWYNDGKSDKIQLKPATYSENMNQIPFLSEACFHASQWKFMRYSLLSIWFIAISWEPPNATCGK